jgi:hypothetical protein
MLRITCPNCHSGLQAKKELIGKVRKCPKCGEPVRIALPEEADEMAAALASDNSIPLDDVEPTHRVVKPTEEHVTVHRPPERLNRESHYLIFDPQRVAAAWENNGDGWMLRLGTTKAPAKRNKDKLPQGGNFQLVELRFGQSADGKKLTAIVAHQLAQRWALTVLDQADDAILERVTGPGRLNRDQKNALRQLLKVQFMRAVWDQSTEIIDYLGNMDFHSPGVEVTAK